MSDTGPSEFAAIVGDENAFRLYVVKKLEEQSGNNALLMARIDAHEKNDDSRFSGITSRLGSVSSSVNDGEKLVAKWNGVKVAVGVFLAFIVTIGGWLVAWFHK